MAPTLDSYRQRANYSQMGEGVIAEKTLVFDYGAYYACILLVESSMVDSATMIGGEPSLQQAQR